MRVCAYVCCVRLRESCLGDRVTERQGETEERRRWNREEGLFALCGQKNCPGENISCVNSYIVVIKIFL